MADLLPGIPNMLPSFSLPNGNSLLSPTADLTSNFKALSDNLTNIQANPDILSNNRLSSNINTSVGQAGALNLQGSLDASTKKTAIIYAPVSANNSPNSRVSSAPEINQSGSDGGLGGLLGGLTQAPGLLIVGGVLVVGLFLLMGAAKPSTVNYRTDTKASASVPASLLG